MSFPPVDTGILRRIPCRAFKKMVLKLIEKQKYEELLVLMRSILRCKYLVKKLEDLVSPLESSTSELSMRGNSITGFGTLRLACLLIRILYSKLHRLPRP